MEQTIRHQKQQEDVRYVCGSKDILYSYYEQSNDDYREKCQEYEERGYVLYRSHEMNGSLFSTYVKNEKMAHIYRIKCKEQLNVIVSDVNGANLPPKVTTAVEGAYTTSVTQLQSSEVNGMGYVIQLADGSFVVYDGGYAHRADELWDTLVTLKGSEKDIVIRGWLITHFHEDHYPCFTGFADKYADQVRVETVLAAPPTMDVAEKERAFLNEELGHDAAKFQDAKICYVYTGMCFQFCNLRMEILFTPDELYSCISSDYYNNTSIVSRVYTEDCSMIFLGDAGRDVAYRLALYYGDYLKSDMCQVSHHGVEDFPLIVYRYIKASILWYPCNTWLYDLTDRDADVRAALRNSEYTKEILLQDKERYTRRC